jgi:1,4-dihydroxy-2-naphthoate octaprenyltransferase
MTRPTHLFLITVVYLFGSTLALAAGSRFDQAAVQPALLVLLLVSASIHMANEYADYETDQITTRTIFSGGSGAFSRSNLPRPVALWGAWVLLIAGLALAILRLPLLGNAALTLLIGGAILGWMYSVSPLRLAWRGLGEIDNALAGGLVLPLYGFAVQAKAIEPTAILANLPFAALVFLNLLATTWPDREADAQVGKMTLATRWPVKRLRMVYWLVAVGVAVSLTLMKQPPIVSGVSWLPMPLVILGGLTYTRKFSPLPAVAAMVLMVGLQLIAWWSLTDFCCWID